MPPRHWHHTFGIDTTWRPEAWLCIPAPLRRAIWGPCDGLGRCPSPDTSYLWMSCESRVFWGWSDMQVWLKAISLGLLFVEYHWFVWKANQSTIALICGGPNCVPFPAIRWSWTLEGPLKLTQYLQPQQGLQPHLIQTLLPKLLRYKNTRKQLTQTCAKAHCFAITLDDTNC